METDEDLIANGVCIDIESGKIDWPMGKQMEPPANESNKRKGGKCSTTNKAGGKANPSKLVNNVQFVLANTVKFKTPTKEGRESTSSAMYLLDLNPSNTGGTGLRGKEVPKRCETA